MASDVFYLNLESLELQAERVIDTSLKNRPIAIISSSGSTGTIVVLSSEAKQEGLYKGMKVSLAKRKNTRVQLLPYNHSLYQRVTISQFLLQKNHLFQSNQFFHQPKKSIHSSWTGLIFLKQS